MKKKLVYSNITSFKPDKSPEVYDLRTPHKKSRNISMVSEDDSKGKEVLHKRGKKEIISAEISSKIASKQSLVDLVLQEESSRSKYSEMGKL